MVVEAVAARDETPAPLDEPGLPKGNAAYPWDAFDPDSYVRTNYLELHDEDRALMEAVRDYFVRELGSRTVKRGIDVGAGANLYPSLLMLPFCRRITLFERGRKNRKWLRRQLRRLAESWLAYWRVLTVEPAYRNAGSPRELLRRRARVKGGTIFAFIPPLRKRHVGTMFFVAESISDQKSEFEKATKRFISWLKPGAPFAAAFMVHSSGYDVGTLRFPAVAVSETDIDECLAPRTHDLKFVYVSRADKPFRDGYEGMILALGRAGRAPS